MRIEVGVLLGSLIGSPDKFVQSSSSPHRITPPLPATPEKGPTLSPTSRSSRSQLAFFRASTPDLPISVPRAPTRDMAEGDGRTSRSGSCTSSRRQCTPQSANAITTTEQGGKLAEGWQCQMQVLCSAVLAGPPAPLV